MNASPTTRTISARWLHSSIVIGSTLLIVAAIAIVLTFRSLSGATPAARSIPALDSYAPLDQHERRSELPAKYGAAIDAYERRSELFTKYGAAIDPYERHPDLFALTAEHAAALDQHERRSELFTKYAAALDQHERHPDLFAPKAEHAALPDALDRYLAAHNRP